MKLGRQSLDLAPYGALFIGTLAAFESCILGVERWAIEGR